MRKIIIILSLIFTANLLLAADPITEGFDPEILKYMDKTNNKKNNADKKELLKEKADLYPDIKLPSKKKVKEEKLKQEEDEAIPYLEEIFTDSSNTTPRKEKGKREKQRNKVKKQKINKFGIIQANCTTTGLGMVKTKAAYMMGTDYRLLSTYVIFNNIDQHNGNDLNLTTDEEAKQLRIRYIFTTFFMENFEFSIDFPLEKWKIATNKLTPNGDESGIGDVRVSLKYVTAYSDTSNFAVGLEVKLATGDEEKLAVNGVTGKPDFEIYAALTKNLQYGALNMYLGYTFTGDPTLANGTTFNIDDKVNYGIGYVYSKNDTINLGLELWGEIWGDFGDKLELIPSLRSKVTENLIFNVAFPITLNNDQEFGYDYQWVGGLDYRF